MIVHFVLNKFLDRAATGVWGQALHEKFAAAASCRAGSISWRLGDGEMPLAKPLGQLETKVCSYDNFRHRTPGTWNFFCGNCVRIVELEEECNGKKGGRAALRCAPKAITKPLGSLAAWQT